MVEIPQVFGLGSFNFGATLNTILTFGLILIVAIVCGGIVFLVFRWRNKKKKSPTKEIHWWEELNGRLVPIRVDNAIEVPVPGSNLKLFYIKDRDTWLFRFTRGITPDVFFVAVTQDKEIVNFTLKSLEQDRKEAGLAYDHTDMRWAAENMREWVKRNYKDKAIPWWKEYQGVITTAIYILVMTFSFVIILYFMRGIVGDIGSVANTLTDAVAKINACAAPNSGVVLGG